MIGIKNVKVDLSGVEKKMPEAMKKAQFALDNAALNDSNEYVPFDEGYLRDSSLEHSDIGGGRLVWNKPYARRLYYNPHYEFSKDTNPQAQGLWFEAAKSEHKDEWVNQAEKAARDMFK